MSATREQQNAIAARGKVIVSASAGAGKTTVMIKRLADIIEGGASLDEVLAVTFTKKAAAQMKTKLRTELIARLGNAEEGGKEHLRAQLNKISAADISTIHAFCARLVRTYFYVLGVDASFDILSEGPQESQLKNRVMDDLFDELYQSKDENLYTLLKCLRKKRSDAALKETLFDAYKAVRIRPQYDELLAACGDTFTDEGFERVCAALNEEIKEKCKIFIGAIDDFALNFNPAVNREGYFKVLNELRESLTAFIERGDIFAPTDKLVTAKKPKKSAEVLEDDEKFSEFVDSIKKKFKALFKDLAPRENEREKFIISGALAKAFSSLITAFDKAYMGVKREEGKLDYGDLEHLALQLLKGESSDGDVREQICSRYKFVFVDEYQDVNPIQDEIISAVAGGDLFCVGDIKQAIYGFRGSSSSFFAAKSEGAEKSGSFIVLPDNFRSAASVIKFVNDLFSEIMKPPVCGIDYADRHEMRGGALYPEGVEGVAEICRFENSGQDKKSAEGVYSVEEATSVKSAISAEGRAVLKLVKEALNSNYYDSDSGTMKKVEAGDICVLCRKRSNKNAQSIVRALVSAGYAVAGAAEVNICERPEIVRILDILSYLENGEQDVPLAAALLSPLGGLTPVQLAKIRVAGGNVKDVPLFRTCVESYVNERDDGLAQRLKLFFERVKKLRALANCTGAASLIDEIVKIGGFAATFDSNAKLTALRCLQREAYSASGELYLSQFLYKIKLGGNRVLAPSSLAADSIKVMTMHASKGLEFPVVIVADVAAQFKGDSYDEMPFDDEFGFAPKYYGQSARVYKNTVLRRLIKFRREQEELNNEINLFYVACTRAKYALYVLNSGTEGYSKVAAAGATSYAELFDADAFNPRTLDIQPIDEAREEGARTIDLSRADERTSELLGEAAFSRYPYALGTELPVKSSASRLIATIEEEGDAPLFGYEITAEKGDGTSIEKGLAYHRFLQLCDFKKRSEKEICDQLAVFVYNGQMTEEERKLLSVDELVKILSMPAFIRLEGKELFREREFVCRLPSEDYLALKGGESRKYTVGEDDGNGVIMQGAIDLLAVRREGGKVISAEIIDYKYSAGNESYVKAHYAPQLALYQSVVAKIYGLPVEQVKKTIINIRTLKQTDM